MDRQRIGPLRRSFARTWHRSSGRSARCSAGSAVRIGYIRCGRPSTPGSSSKYRLNGGLENKNDAGCGSRPASLPPCAAVGSHRWLTTVSGLPAIVLSAQQLRQLGDVGGDASGLVLGEQLGRAVAIQIVGKNLISIIPRIVEYGVIYADAIVNYVSLDAHNMLGPRIAVAKVCEPRPPL